MKKPIIGITSMGSASEGKYRIGFDYAHRITEASGIPIILTPNENEKETIDQLIMMCDGFLFTGGPDVDPTLYGEDKSDLCGEPNAERDEFELNIIPYILETDKPLFCICRGIQVLNVALGGTLYQDCPCSTLHSDGRHIIRLCSKEYKEMFGFIDEAFETNSFHHQSIKELGKGLVVTSISEDDGVIEGVYMPEKRFVIGVQWHPEKNGDDEITRKLFSSFIAACK